MNKLTAETVTDDEIRALLAVASFAGDAGMITTCKCALGGRQTVYRQECADAINAANAKEQSPVKTAEQNRKAAEILSYLIDQMDHRRAGETHEIPLLDGRLLSIAHVNSHASIGETISVLTIKPCP